MSTKATIFLTIVLTVVGILAIRFLSGPEDFWMCQNGFWVKHGNPKDPMPSILCNQTQEEEKIRVFSPAVGEKLSGEFEITGEAKGSWFFEGDFPVKLVDENGNELAIAIAKAKGDWMTEDYVSFSAKMNVLLPQDTQATLVLIKDNPSGLPENDDKLEIPVVIKGSDVESVKLYFGKAGEEECDKVFAVERSIPKTKTPATDTMKELLRGASEKERLGGYFTNINEGVEVNKLTIQDGVAKIDFNEKIEEGAGGSCRAEAIRSQISETLKQFFSVHTVIISVDGRTEDVLQP